jgi:multiple sugar transport system substrate-binding protein
MTSQVSRRSILKAMALAGGGLLAACAPAAQPTAAVEPTTAPVEPTKAAEPTMAPAEPTATVAANPPAAEGVNLRVFFGANPEEAKVRQTIFDGFTALNPNIKITPEIPTQNTTEALLTEVAGGDPPDVAMAWELQYPILAEKGAYKDLGDLINADANYGSKVLPDFYKSHIDMYTWKGKLYVLPEQNASVVLYYNKKLFDDAGVAYPPSDWSDKTWDWAKFLDACKKLTKSDGNTITQYGYTEAWWPPLSAVIFAYSNGGNWFDRYSDPTKVTVTDPKVVQAFQFYADLWNKEKVATNPEAWKVQAGYQMFAAGKAAMTLVGHWFYPEFSKAEHNLSMDIGVFPVGPGGTTSKTDLGGTGMSIVNLTKHLDEAWKFLSYECGPEGQKVIAKSGLFAPTLQSVANSPDFLNAHTAIKNAVVFNTAMENAVSFPIGPAWDAMADPLGRDLDALWNGTSNAEESLTKAQDEMQKALDEGRSPS